MISFLNFDNKSDLFQFYFNRSQEKIHRVAEIGADHHQKLQRGPHIQLCNFCAFGKVNLLLFYSYKLLKNVVTSILFSPNSSKRFSNEESTPDSDEQRKIAEGADALLNLAGIATALVNESRGMMEEQPLPVKQEPVSRTKSEGGAPSKAKRRLTAASNNNFGSPDKRRKRWREWGEGNRYLKQVRG